ncbi:MAG: acyl-CoA/acyl-ACP dehydrogenase [Candidatus Heimdallarchaeota archaeon]|nr:acyl-CoA/acyl-ACP dehydrogenase [Candidatus Heimdallarchaeota archaeon]MDH5647089.1 acyl-CoA/acyl-ACP dehydrogenase [Candidatus Heimdallarchaeota archaeon]
MLDVVTQDDLTTIINDIVIPFIEVNLLPMVSRHELPMSSSDFEQLIVKTHELGFVDTLAKDKTSMWTHPGDGLNCWYSIQMLIEISKTNTAFALALHQTAISYYMQQLLNESFTERTFLLLQGHYGLARFSLAHLLSNNLTTIDIQELNSYFQPNPDTYCIFHELDTWSSILLPEITINGVNWIKYERNELEVEKQSHSLGFDELNTYKIRLIQVSDQKYESNSTPNNYTLLFQIQQMVMIALAAGALYRALKMARNYASIRSQGGNLLHHHSAIKILLSSAEATYQQALTSLQSIALQGLSHDSLRRVISTRIQLQSHIHDATNSCLQVFGGMGYMQDTGLEKIVRDCHQLKLMYGTPMELQLLLSELGQDATPFSPSSTPVITGFISSSHVLSPKVAFNSISRLTRWMIKYNSMDMWEYETKSLPKPLEKLRRKSRKFAETYLSPISMKLDVLPHPEPGELNEDLQNLLVIAGKSGFLTDLLPKPLGSVSLLAYRFSSALRFSLKVEEFSKSCGGLMLLLNAHHLGVAPILLSGDIKAIRKFMIPAYKENKKGKPHIFAYAITEPNGGSDVEEGHGAAQYKPGVIARKSKGGWILNGTKIFISGGGIAKSVTLFAALEDEGIESWTCFLIRNTMAGYRVARTELKMGMRVSDAAELVLENVFVPDDHVIGGLRKGWALNRAVLNLSRIPVGAMGVGFAQAATDIAIEFATSYKLNDIPLIHYQEIQLQISQMIAETSSIRSLIWNNARTWVPRQGNSAMSKFYCTDIALGVVEKAMSLLSNHAVLHDNRVEKVFRDTRLTQIFEGTNQINRLSMIEDFQEEFLAKVSKEYNR